MRNFEIPSETITCIISYIFGEKSAMWRHFRSNTKKTEKMYLNSKQQIILGTLFIVWRKIVGEEKIQNNFWLISLRSLFSCNQRVLSKQLHSRTYEGINVKNILVPIQYSFLATHQISFLLKIISPFLDPLFHQGDELA